MKDRRTLSQIIFDLKMSYARQFNEKFIINTASEAAITAAARKIKQGRFAEWVEKNGIKQVRIY